MKNWIKRNIYGICAGVLLTSFTGYALLDTFVIPRSYSTVAEAEQSADDAQTADENVSDSLQEVSGSDTENSDSANTDTENSQVTLSVAENNQASGNSSSVSLSGAGNSGDSTDAEALSEELASAFTTEPVLTSTSYSDSDTSIEISEYRVNDTTIYMADVVLASSDALKTALANDTYGKNVKDKTSSIASDNAAILAINGDFYGARTTGYVIRNGVLYRSTSSGSEDLVIYADGSFGIINENEVSAQELLDNGAVQVFSFGPALVQNGEIAVTEDEEVGKAMASNPRTAIGIISDNHYVLVVSDGRTSESEGLSLYELAEFMESLGVTTAYNLDGGGSSTMVFNGNVVNNPTTGGNSIKERSVSDIVYIGV